MKKIPIILYLLFCVASVLRAELGDELAYENNSISVFEHVAPSVVYIENKELRRDYYSLNVLEIPRGSGTGFIWDTQGHIVTNFHVIYGASLITVTLPDNSVHRAKLVGSDISKDLAVLHIENPPRNLKPITPGDSSRLKVGSKALAIGNPFGLDHTLTVGVVSALGREITSLSQRTIHDVIQTDASINPGNSGGPLLNSKGELIGINTQIKSPSGASAGIGFAVPVNIIKRIVPQLIKYGKVIRPAIGITALPDSVALRLGVKGIVVHQVRRGGPAERAGIRGISRNWMGEMSLGDIVLAIDGKPVANLDDLGHELEQKNIGDRAIIRIKRGGKIKNIPLVLGRSE